MEDSSPDRQEGTDWKIIEEIIQLEKISLGEGAATCQVCGSSLREGEAVVVYVFRPAGEVMFQVGHVVCGDEGHELPTEYTLGVRELLVEGRIGLCSDGATQSSWPVLLDPEVSGVSAAATKSLRRGLDGDCTEMNVESHENLNHNNRSVDRISPDTVSNALDHDHLLTDGGTTPPEPESGTDDTDTPESDDVDRTPSLTPSVREFLRQDRGNECELCGTNDADGEVDLEIHHRVPKSEGGTDQPSNLMLVCRQCHQRHHGNTPSDRAVEAESPSDEDPTDEATSETRTPLEPRSSPNETDSEILSIIEDEGPVPTGVIAEQVGCSKQHVRRQCWWPYGASGKLSGEQLIAPTKNEQWELLESASNQEITIGLPEKPKQAKRAGRDEVIRRMSAHGMAHTKIAEITGLSRATVDVAVDRARALRIDQAEEPSADLGAVAMRVSALLDLINHAQTESVDSQSLGD
jgi:5-methylcytosine-specific restriction endonuclease McrA